MNDPGQECAILDSNRRVLAIGPFADPHLAQQVDGRVFRMSTALRTLWEAQQAEHKTLTKAGHVVPWVF
jgi:hypothetical protein